MPGRETDRTLEVEKLFVVRLGQPLLSAPERPLGSSVVAVDGLRDVDAAELLKRVFEDPLAKDPLPGPGERLRDRGHMGANRLGLGSRRTKAAGLLHVQAELGICETRLIDVADPRHLRDANASPEPHEIAE